MKVYYGKTRGRYNICSYEEQWRVFLLAGNVSISETWGIDDEPPIEGLPPSAVVEIINDRLESYLYSSSRDSDRKKIDWLRNYADEIDHFWASERIKQLSKKRKALKAFIMEEVGEVPEFSEK